MPSIMVYANNEVYDYLYLAAKEQGVTPAKVASGILEDFLKNQVKKE